MAKTQGFKVRIDAFLPIDKKDFAKQAATYKLIAEIQESGELPDDFFETATILSVDAKQGGVDLSSTVTLNDKGGGAA